MSQYWGDIPATTALGAGEAVTVGASAGTWTTVNASYKHISVMIPSPVANTGNFFFRANQKLNIVRIDSCVRAATSAAFNIEIHSDPTTPGDDVLAGDATADTNGDTQTSFKTTTINSGSWLFVHISAVSGTPQVLSITIVCQVTS